MTDTITMTREEFNQLKENLELLEQDMEQHASRFKKLRHFAQILFEMQFKHGVCEDDVEVVGLKCGLLERKTFNKPCIEPEFVESVGEWMGGCACSQYCTRDEWEEGVQCNRIVEWLLEEDS